MPNLVQRFSGDAWFSDADNAIHLDGVVNSQSCRMWETERPDVVMEKPLYSHRGPSRGVRSESGALWFLSGLSADGSTVAIAE